ncbi:2-keto-4-pentenoate hydratase [Rhizobium sp. PP-F2F-G48]|uniref:hypothetical protein n=1 Tax=Rhizobium sp. PP-F2F-G48 TaxID=2135651 RepID=UPI00104984BB|nr:hypothetical protein [Rhizobium sp. PP-F2F-G48]TCM53199.1 2-keto-4-pentenoate hydratase [Rhizobium sp. PP-F2F-G48]
MGRDLADILVEAIRNDGMIEGDAISQPDLAEAYAIQSAVIGQLGITPQGCKLSLRDGGVLSAPLLSATETASFPYQPEVKLEVEIALVLGRDLPVRAQSYSRQEIREAISAVRMGIEFVRSRYVGGPQGRTGFLVADLMSNAGYRLGPALDAAVLDEDHDAEHLQVTAGDQSLFDAPGRHPDKDPLAALVAYANDGHRPAETLRQGTVVTTGSLCGGLLISRPATASIRLGRQAWTMDILG